MSECYTTGSWMERKKDISFLFTQNCIFNSFQEEFVNQTVKLNLWCQHYMLLVVTETNN